MGCILQTGCSNFHFELYFIETIINFSEQPLSSRLGRFCGPFLSHSEDIER